MKLNIIHGNKPERLAPLLTELDIQGVNNYELWEGVYLPHSVKASINAAHRQIVEYAQLAGWERVCIAEDDLRGTALGAWEYYLSQMPDDFDIYLSMIYSGEIGANNVCKSFTGLTLYTVHERFYETFLNVNKEEHIDRALDGLGKYVVCNPFTFYQANGVSGNTGKYEEYDSLLTGRELFGR